ncbi:S-adenosyl-L-methionine-dependent methyltransferase [Hyaloraphidium curvatum]|nr:S-adenosyl-L-methionine-dependent methyltransferase [Hyaloraphidium curvatum]
MAEGSDAGAQLLLKAAARCGPADVSLVRTLLEKDPLLVHTARDAANHNRSPLHFACAAGSLEVVKLLLDNGAQWNVVDDVYISAGDLARDNGHDELYEFMVTRGVETEFLIRVLEDHDMEDADEEGEGEQADVDAEDVVDQEAAEADSSDAPKKDEDEFTLPNPIFVNGKAVQPPSKPGTGTDLDTYLSKEVKYEDEHGRLLDANGNAIEMEWERIIMDKHAEVVAPVPGLSVVNVGFGMGMVDEALHKREPRLHTICEAHPVVLERIKKTPWISELPADRIRILFGKWQDTLAEDLEPFDGIFFDTFSEQYDNSLLPLHRDYLPRLLRRPDPSKPGDRGGIYSFFNGLGSGNKFFHDVACRIAELDLEEFGFETEWVTWDFAGPDGETARALGKDEGDKVWQGIRYDYWRLGNKYRCPIVRWKAASG